MSTPTGNDITELRSILFETLRGVKSGQVDLDKAKAVSDLAQVVINTAKVEVDYLKTTGNARGTGFLGQVEDEDTGTGALTSETPTGVKTVRKHGRATVTTHRLK